MNRSVISCGGNVFEPGATAQASRLPTAVYRATRLNVREHDHVCGRTLPGIRVNAFQLPRRNAWGLAAHSFVAVCAVGRRIAPPHSANSNKGMSCEAPSIPTRKLECVNSNTW